MNGINVLDWTAGPFLALYIALYLVCLAASAALSRVLRADGTAGSVTDAEEAAVLGGGRDRLGEVVATRLLERRVLAVEKGKLLRQPGAQGLTAVEIGVLGLASPISWKAMRKVTDVGAGQIEHRLVRRGLWVDTGEARRAALTACWPLLALLLLGLAKALIGSARGHPVGLLLGLMALTVLTVVIRTTTASRITRAGKAALREATRRSARLKLAPAHGEAGMAVALFGTGVLATSALGDFHRMRATNGSDGGGGDSSSSSDGDGGSGCGGGGCGGCGG